MKFASQTVSDTESQLDYFNTTVTQAPTTNKHQKLTDFNATVSDWTPDPGFVFTDPTQATPKQEAHSLAQKPAATQLFVFSAPAAH
eukprot:1006435-Rhodomonas_salina.1